jgi:hypothetical protein
MPAMILYAIGLHVYHDFFWMVLCLVRYLATLCCCADAKFQSTGLERSAALAADIAWFREQYGLPAPELKEEGPGRTYARHLQQIATDDPQFFICHFYNYYFAHTAGGRMIGNKVGFIVGMCHLMLTLGLKATAVPL